MRLQDCMDLSYNKLINIACHKGFSRLINRAQMQNKRQRTLNFLCRTVPLSKINNKVIYKSISLDHFTNRSKHNLFEMGTNGLSSADTLYEKAVDNIINRGDEYNDF